MNTEDRLRQYLVSKASTLQIPGRLMPATPPPVKRSRTGTVLLATASALVLIGLPLLFLSLVSVETPNVADTLAITTLATEAPTTTSATATTAAPLVDPVAPSQSCAEASPVQPERTVLTFYASCEGVPYPIYRAGAAAPTLQESLAALLAGTTAEERSRGLYAGFDGVEGAASVEVSATVDEAGLAQIDLTLGGSPWLADTGSWSSTQLNSLLDPLQATVFADPTVTGLDMTTLCFEQIACDRVVTRAEWAGILFTNTGSIVHFGCTPEDAWTDPSRCTLGGVLSATTFSGTVADIRADDTLNVRAGPGEEYFRVDELNLGQNVVVTNGIALASDGAIWRIVDSPTTEPGWVNAAYLDIVEP